MKLKLLFFMGILSVFFNTVSGQSNTAPFFSRTPVDRVVCPGYTAANIRYQTDDDNTFAEDLIVTATYTNLSGSQAVTFINTYEAGGINRTITVIPTGPVFTESVVEVTITVSGVGNPLPNLTATTTFTVTFEDNAPPVINNPLSFVNADVTLDTACGFTMPDYTTLLNAVDACEGIVSNTNITQTPAPGAIVSGGDGATQLVVLTATDNYGNASSLSFTITLQDETPPTVVVNNPVTVQLDSMGVVTITPQDIDNGSTDNCNIPASLSLSIDISSFDCSNLGDNDVKLTVTDTAGNSASQTVTVIVEDTIEPTITCSADVTVSNDLGECSALVTLTLPMSSDNCGVTASSATRSDSLALSAPYPVGDTTVKWVVEDSSGNSASCTQTVTVEDNEAPNAITQNITVELDSDGNASITETQINDGSTDNCDTAVSLSLDITTFDCTNIGANTVVLTVTDNFGNSASATATVTVVDEILPTIMTSGPIAIGTDDNVCVGTTTVDPATATDNCSVGSPTWVRSDSALTLNAPFEKGETTITWSVTDLGGNVASATQTVTVTDDQAPVFASSFPDLIVDNDVDTCGYLTSQLTVPSVSDNCTPFDGVVTVFPEFIDVSAGPDHVPTIVTWTATDDAGNVVSATQSVLVRDLELPVMRTRNITRYFDRNGQIIVNVADIDNGSTDNSGETCFKKSVVDNIIDCNESGVHDVVLFGEDLWGNQHYSIAKVTALDNTAPTFVGGVLPAIDLNTNSACTWVGLLTVPATADNCSVVSITNDITGPLTAGLTVVTWTVTDASGNVASATQEVTVIDSESPVAKAKLGVVATLDPAGSATITVFDIDNGSTDNCGIVVSSVFPNTFTCSNIGANVVTLTVTDSAGNTSEIDTIVTVQDITAPTVITMPFTAQLSAAGTVTITAANVNNGSNDACGIKSMTVSPSTFTCANVGANTVTLTVTDNNNNVSTGTAIVTVQDSVSPTVITKSFTAQLGVTGNVTITAADVNNGSTDACGIATMTVSPSLFSCTNVGANTVTLTVTDVNGNVASSSAVVTVEDKIAPIAKAKAITVQLDANGSATITTAQANNNSTDNCGITSYTLSKTIFTCNDLGLSTVTLTATDAAGNVSLPVNVEVTVQDELAPVVNTQNITVSLDASGNVSIVPSQVNNGSTDNCGIASYALNKTTFNCSNVGPNTVTLTVIDSNGNSNSATATVTVQETVKPVVRTRNITIQLNTLGLVSIVTSDINNGSTDNCGIVTYGLSKTSFNCSNVGSNTVTLTATDAAGNTASATAIVTVQDKVLPVLNATVATVTRNSDANACGALITITAPTTSDNCTIGAAVGTRSDSLALTALYPVGTTTITWSLTDANGNIALPTTTTVNVTDATAPVVNTKNIIVSLDASGNVSIVPSQVNNVSTDNCGIASYSLDKTTFNCSNVGANTVALTVIDINGNSNSATATVTVQDLVKPIVRTRNITVQLSTSGLVSIITSDINNGSTDNCGIVTYGLSKTSFDCNNVGSNTVTLTATDAAGNSESATATVTVQDKVVPTVITKNITVQLNAAGTVTIVAADVNNGSSDVCGVQTLAISKATFTCANVGANVITLTVTDVNGNVNQGFATVTVVDSIIPVITTNGNKTATADLGGCSAIVTVSATATDNCSVGMPTGVRSDAKPLAAAYPVGITTITWNVTDVNGNAAVAATQTVTVTDTQIPVITANGNKFVTSDAGQCGAVVAVSATATDNCSVGSPIATRSDALVINAPFAVGTTTITWNVTDINGNAAVAVVQTVTVRDLQIPVINGTVVSIDANTNTTVCAATVSITAPTASDNCTVGSPVGTRSDNLALTALYPLGTTTITWRVTDINGNAAIPTTTTVKVKDMVLPTVITQNIAVQLNVGGFVTIVPAQVNNGSTDNCGIASYSLDKISFNCSNVGANTVTLTVIDIHGNMNTATATVTVSEPIIPIARTRNIIVQLNAAGTVSILPSDINNGSTDNCSIASYELSKSTFNCTNVGQNIITLTAIDASGNRSVAANATVTVEDKVAPVVLTKTFVAQLNASGTVTITAANVDNGSTDACGIKGYSISKSTFTCDNVGENIITLSVTDVNNNVGQAFATVNVVDSVKPVVVTKNIELVLDGSSVSIKPEDVLVSATDACGVDITSYTLSKDTFTYADVLASPVTITVSATDVNGNVGTSTAIITFPVVPTNAVEAITPNGDGLNDTWVIENITNHPKSVVRVYNRWGSMVFSALNYQNNWDGRLNGSDATLPDGQAYYYQVDLKGNGTIDKEGWLYIKK